MAVRADHPLPLSVRTVDTWSVVPRCSAADRMGAHRQDQVPQADEAVRQDLPDQLRDGRGHRYRPGVPVRDELVHLFSLRGRHLRCSAGHGGSVRVLPGGHVHRPVDLRVESSVQARSPGDDLAHLGSDVDVGILHPRRKCLHAESGRVQLQRRNVPRGTDRHLGGRDESDRAERVPAHDLRRGHVRRSGHRRRGGLPPVPTSACR